MEQREEVLSGHLCRCTGYFPIKNAVKNSPIVDIEELAGLCASCPNRKIKFELENFKQYVKPQSITELKSILTNNSGVTIVSGNTGRHVEKYYTEKSKDVKMTTVDLSQVQEMRQILPQGDSTTIGAAVTLEELRHHLSQSESSIYRKAAEFMLKVGSGKGFRLKYKNDMYEQFVWRQFNLKQ